MAERRNRYHQMQQYMVYALLAALVLFIVYLIAAGNDITWLKAVLAVLIFLICAICLVFLFMTRELLRPRSLWMTTAAGAIALCLLFSLILHFPCPNPRNQTDSPADDSAAVMLWENT